ncbi:MAG: hypothetical protein NC177_01425 [Ruminococcus flavefaciens]|nr:hypothetical protein [Ruminococcus flavefaciens]
MIENLYCKIFVDTVSEYNDFFEKVRNFLDGHKQAVSFIINDWCSLSISRNKEYIPASSDFLYWKFIIDIEPVENISENTYINNIKNLIYFLKKQNKAICACDFEELLQK